MPANQRGKRLARTATNPPELFWEDFKPIEWTTEELDSYLSRKAKELDGPELASLTSTLFPFPDGFEPRPNRLKPGSISLSDQLRLCRKHLDDSNDFAAALAGIWALYKGNDSIVGFRQEIIDQLEPGILRTEMMADYCYIRSQTPLEFADFSASLELAKIVNRKVSSDHKGIIRGFESSIRDMLIKDETLLDEIENTLNSSNLEKATISKMVDYAIKTEEKIRTSRAKFRGKSARE